MLVDPPQTIADPAESSLMEPIAHHYNELTMDPELKP
jgi:hypothetical protein